MRLPRTYIPSTLNTAIVYIFDDSGPDINIDQRCCDTHAVQHALRPGVMVEMGAQIESNAIVTQYAK